MTYFPRVEKWFIPQQAIALSFEEMARDGSRGNEGIALWLGGRDRGQATVSHVVALRGSGIVRHPDFLSISPDVMNEVTDLAIRLQVVLVGQIHSHGPSYGIDLSPTDRLYGVAIPYFLSVVAPDYGLRPTEGVAECGVHVYEPKRGYRRLGIREVTRRIIAVSNPQISTLLVGRSR